jgi:hypothetical protein
MSVSIGMSSLTNKIRLLDAKPAFEHVLEL